VGIGRFALPSALAGLGLGILAADAGIGPPIWAVIGGGLALAVVSFAVGGGRSRWPGTIVLAGILVAFGGVGTWRHAASKAAMAPGTWSVAALIDGQEHEVLGTVMDDPRPREDRVQLVLGDLVAQLDGRAGPLDDRLLVWLPRGVRVVNGDRLRVITELEEPEDFDGFAYRAYLARQGVGAIARPRVADVVDRASGPATGAATVRAALLRGLNRMVPEPEAALGAGILLGVRASIAPELNAAFATTGLTHVVAISGWNIAIVAALVAAVVRPLGRRPGGRWTTSLVATSAVAGYVVLVGASPSVVRAALMAGCMLVARLGGSRAHAVSALQLAALLMLLVAPQVLWDVGFQLSVLATAGLIWFGAPVERRLAVWPAWVREPVALTLAAQLTTLPVILVNFERLSLVAPLANVLVVPFVPLAMLFSAVASVAGVLDSVAHVPGVGDTLTWFAGGTAWLVLHVIVGLGSVLASLPLASLDVSIPPALAVAWLPMLGLASWALRTPDPQPIDRETMTAGGNGAVAAIVRRTLRPLPVAAFLLATLLTLTSAARPDGRLHVTILDIGQGDAILVEAPSGATALIDGGPDPDLTLRRLGAGLPFFVRSIDLLVLTHPHHDHVTGLIEALDRFRVGAVLHAGIPFDNPAYDRLLADATLARVPVALARTGQVLELDATTTLTVVYPTAADAAAPLPEGDINNGSIVMLLRHGGFTALLTGDARAPIEATLLERGLLPTIDLLKVGHHGSASSTTPGLLDVIRPTLAVVSAGRGNPYGHPAPETMARLGARPDVAAFRTDRDGDVEIVSDGSGYQVRTDAGGRGAPHPVHAAGATASIGRWPSPTDPRRDACWPMPRCPKGSWSTPRAWPAWPLPPPPCWLRRESRSTACSSRPRRCCTTSTSSRFEPPVGSTGSWVRVASRRRGTPSSRCRSPPIRSAACSTTSDSRAAGRRSWWPWPTATWPASS
jgi:competence protein ComEC